MQTLSNQPSYEGNKGEEAQPAPEPGLEQQEVPQSSYQQEPSRGYHGQELPPPVPESQPYIPPGGYQQYGYQQQQQQYGYQPQPGDVGPFERTSMGMKARTAGTLCYLFGWVTGLIFFLLERENRFVRFHAMQSILFFGSLSVLEGAFSNLPLFGPISGALGLVGFIGWIFLMVAAHRGRYYKLPIIGDLAEKLVGEIKV